MLPVIQVGPVALPAPQLLLLIGFWVGLELTEKHAHRYGSKASNLYNMVLIAMIAGLIGARIGYALQAPQAFLQSPLNLLALQAAMFDLPSGLFAALIAGSVYGLYKRLPIWPTLDALTTLFSVMAVTLGLSHFASGDAFGAPASIPWAIPLWGELRHPSQVYETLAALGIAAATWPGSRVLSASKQGSTPNTESDQANTASQTSGFRFWTFLALTAAAQLFLESFRGDSTLVLNLFRQAQLIAWAVLALSLWQLGRRFREHTFS